MCVISFALNSPVHDPLLDSKREFRTIVTIVIIDVLAVETRCQLGYSQILSRLHWSWHV